MTGSFVSPFTGDVIQPTDVSYASSSNTNLPFYIGAHFGAVSVGIGAFIFILSLIGFIDDYNETKKRIIDRLIKQDQEKAAAEAKEIARAQAAAEAKAEEETFFSTSERTRTDAKTCDEARQEYSQFQSIGLS